jgi:hypothetical protein
MIYILIEDFGKAGYGSPLAFKTEGGMKKHIDDNPTHNYNIYEVKIGE